MNLVIFGLGYSSRAFLAHQGQRFAHVTGTVRHAARAEAMMQAHTPDASRLAMQAFDGTSGPQELAAAIHAADAVLVSAPPDEGGDPVLRCFTEELAAAPALKWIGYLSTVGVYGDHDGAWVDEATPCRPVSPRSVARLKAESEWLALGQQAAKAVQVFRLSGIYGPGRNALVNLCEGTARRIDKPGQVFNRIHVADIAGAVTAAMSMTLNGQPAPAIFNITDNEPCPPQDVVAYAARLMGRETPPLIPFAEAQLSAMGRSFYGENKRVSNQLIRQATGYSFMFPTYREGLDGMWNDIVNSEPAGKP